MIENLFDTVFEKLDEAIDMKKGLLADTEDVAVGSSLHGIEGKEAEDGGAQADDCGQGLEDCVLARQGVDEVLCWICFLKGVHSLSDVFVVLNLLP